MSDIELTGWLLAVFIGLLLVLALMLLHERANPIRSELEQVLMRNEEDE